jgi:hypothetical protein
MQLGQPAATATAALRRLMLLLLQVVRLPVDCLQHNRRLARQKNTAAAAAAQAAVGAISQLKPGNTVATW